MPIALSTSRSYPAELQPALLVALPDALAAYNESFPLVVPLVGAGCPIVISECGRRRQGGRFTRRSPRGMLQVPIETRIVRWLLALPLLTEHELATLCRVSLESVHQAVSTLREQGWAFELRLSGSDLRGGADERVLAVSDRGMTALQGNREQAEAALRAVAWWQCSPSAVRDAVAQAPVTRAVNRAIAAAAAEIEQGELGAVTWAFVVPPASARHELPPSTPAGQAAVCWRAGPYVSWFGIHIDSGLAPSAAWRRLRAQWRTASERSVVAARSPVLVVCPRDHDVRVWESLLRRSASRQDPDELPRVALAVASDALGSHACNDRAWSDPRRGEWEELLDHVRWFAADDADPVQTAEDDVGPPPRQRPPWIGGAAVAAASRRAMEYPPARASGRQRTAALALRLSAGEHRITGWLASTPWLSAEDIARIEGASPLLIRRRLRVLRDADVAFVAESSDGPRWALRPAGRDLVAARAGFPRDRGRFAREASLQWWDEPPDSVSGHEAAVSRMIGLLAGAARRDGWTLTAWFDQRYWRRELQSRRPRPDAMAVIEGPARERLIAICEYERANPGRQSAARKVAQWWGWYAEPRWDNEQIRVAMLDRYPLLLFVYGDYGRAPGSLVQAVESLPASIPACVGHEDLLDKYGLDAPVWRTAGGGTASLIARARSAAG